MTEDEIKTLEDIKEEIKEKFSGSSYSDRKFLVSQIIHSKSKKLIAYKLHCHHYDYPSWKSFCEVRVYDVQKGKDIKTTGKILLQEPTTYSKEWKYDEVYSEKGQIDSILDISDEGEVKYTTVDGLEHLL